MNYIKTTDPDTNEHNRHISILLALKEGSDSYAGVSMRTGIPESHLPKYFEVLHSLGLIQK